MTPNEGFKLPEADAFVKGLVGEALGNAAGAGITAKFAHDLSFNLSKEFRGLIVQFCATCIEALELKEIKWEPLAKRMGTRPEFLSESAVQMQTDGSLWVEVLGERIRRASAMKLFTDLNWQKLESAAVGKLLIMLDRGMIRDSGELIAIAQAAGRSTASRAPAGGTQVNLNFGSGSIPDGELPAAGAKMTINLSPRAAKSLEQGAPIAESRTGGDRVIDGEMIGADELRTLLLEKAAEPLPIEREDESNQENGQ